MDIEDLRTHRQLMAESPKVDFSQMGGKPVVVDLKQDQIDLDIGEMPEIAHAALSALENMDIPGGSILAYTTEDGMIRLSNEVETLTPDSRSRIFLNDQGIVIDNATTHRVGVAIDITPQENGGYNIELRANHEGSYDGTIDASRTYINYQIDENGELINREGSAMTEEFGINIMDQEHGKWTVDAAQTLENNFATIYGGDFKEDIEEARPETAAKNVAAPPAASNAANLSGFDLQALSAGTATNEMDQSHTNAGPAMDFQ